MRRYDAPWGDFAWALLTVVDCEGVTQRVIHEWPEDKPGELIKPKPIVDWDWIKWRADCDARLLPPAPKLAHKQDAGANVIALSPLRRQMLQRKLLKAKRRA